MKAPPRVTLEVQGRPLRLNDLIVKGTLTSEQPVEVWLCQGKPVTRLQVKIGKYVWDLLDESFTSVHPKFLLNELTEERKSVTKFRWEFRAEEMILEGRRESLEASFERGGDVHLLVGVPVTAPGTNSGYRVISAKTTVPALGEP